MKVFLDSSWNSGKCGAGFGEEVFLVEDPVSPTIDDLDGAADAFDDTGVQRIAATGKDSVPVMPQIFDKQLQR